MFLTMLLATEINDHKCLSNSRDILLADMKKAYPDAKVKRLSKES